MTLFAPTAPSAAATAVIPPPGVDSGLIVKELKSRFGAIITNGQGEMKGQIFRIAHLGFFDYMDTIALIGALEQVVHKSLPQLNKPFGTALIAAQQVFAEASHPAAEKRSCICGRTDGNCSLQHTEAGAHTAGARRHQGARPPHRAHPRKRLAAHCTVRPSHTKPGAPSFRRCRR